MIRAVSGVWRLLPFGLLTAGLVPSELTAGGQAQFAYKLADGSLVPQSPVDLTLRDEKRKKDLEIRIHYPKGDGPFPVILFSHGFGGNRDAFGYLSKFLASHGFVSIHPTHADSFKEKKFDWKAMQKGLADPEKWIERVGDLTFLLDKLPELEQKVPTLRGKLDSKRVGVSGHSFGAYTSQLIGGVTVELGKDSAKSFADERVKAILPISPQGAGQQGLNDKSWDKMKVPMMTISGTRDSRPGKEASWRKEPFDRSSAGNKYELFLDGAHHMSFGGRLGPDWMTDAIKVAVLAFWDANLKEINEAREYLHSDNLVQFAEGKLSWRKK